MKPSQNPPVLSEQTYFCLDLEFNQPSAKLIEVGLAFGRVSQSLEELTVRNWCLDPGEAISPEIEALTGISDQLIADKAVSLARMRDEFADLLGQHPGRFLSLLTWGVDDVDALKTTLAQAGLASLPLGHRFFDVKTAWSFLRMSQGKSAKGGLSSAMQTRSLRFVGSPHRAGNDALNTLWLFFNMLERQHTFECLPALLSRA